MDYYDYGLTGLILGFIGTFWILAVVWIVLKVVAGWKIFGKAGQPGWVSIVPFYNSYIEYKIYWGNGWLFLVPLVLGLLGGIPIIGSILVLLGAIIGIITKYKQAVAFGQGIGFTVGLVLLNPIFCMILGFGSYEYYGVPLDGYSYGELRNKYYNYKASHPSQQTTYEQPPQDHQPNVKYGQPDTQAQQQQYPLHHGPIYQQPAAPNKPNDEQNHQNSDDGQNNQ